MASTLDGGRACGSVRYRLEDEPIVVHCCHCRFCQRMSGSAFGLNAMIETERVTLLGRTLPEPVPTPPTHPKGQVWYRCPSCQVSV
ncbi:GFA family protein [Kaustia mangrovi]|uniref:GFA family protein n=1 Tax=Kaustia mangrovi TaxID=2593653 RepID=A0A7S8C7U5_9HYPH|nr:GFA family protein [Kaustia mangrovi]QPC45025.1 GFA family protein [Kaustia mangrovi]